jgi:hypothetical protein
LEEAVWGVLLSMMRISIGDKEERIYLGLLVEALPCEGEDFVLTSGEVVFGRHAVVGLEV